MSTMLIISLIVLYLLSVGFWSTFLLLNKDSLLPRVVRVMAWAMFIPGLNTLAAIVIAFKVWYSVITEG